MYNQIEKLASAIRNDVVAGLRGYHTNLSMSMEQLCQDIVDERLQILKEYSLKGVLPLRDLYLSINCIQVDCKNIERCRCNTYDSYSEQPMAHFEIPQIVNDYGNLSIDYIGSTDRQNSFNTVISLSELKNRKYRKRGNDKPYVWIDYAPNINGMLDCFLFNAPFVEQVSVVAVFKDPRDLNKYFNINNSKIENINKEVLKW